MADHELAVFFQGTGCFLQPGLKLLFKIARIGNHIVVIGTPQHDFGRRFGDHLQHLFIDKFDALRQLLHFLLEIIIMVEEISRLQQVALNVLNGRGCKCAHLDGDTVISDFSLPLAIALIVRFNFYIFKNVFQDPVVIDALYRPLFKPGNRCAGRFHLFGDDFRDADHAKRGMVLHPFGISFLLNPDIHVRRKADPIAVFFQRI